MEVDILKGIRVVLAEPKLSLRKEFLHELKSLGCTDIIETGNLADVYKAFEAGGVEVLIGDATLPEGNLGDAVYDIRHGVLGDNPFVIAMLLISGADVGLLEKVINSGVDDVQIKPIGGHDLRDRIVALSQGRKRFVVTSNYIGPDRRRKGELAPGSVEVPLIKVPNPLQMRISGRLGDMATRRAISGAVTTVNEQRVERHAYSVNWLMQKIGKMQAGDLAVDSLNMKEQFDRLHDIAEDISSRLDGTSYKHATELCLTLEKMSHALRNAPELAGEEELHLLGRLTEVISRKCNGQYIDSYFSGESMDGPKAVPPPYDEIALESAPAGDAITNCTTD